MAILLLDGDDVLTVVRDIVVALALVRIGTALTTAGMMGTILETDGVVGRTVVLRTDVGIMLVIGIDKEDARIGLVIVELGITFAIVAVGITLATDDTIAGTEGGIITLTIGTTGRIALTIGTWGIVPTGKVGIALTADDITDDKLVAIGVEITFAIVAVGIKLGADDAIGATTTGTTGGIALIAGITGGIALIIGTWGIIPVIDGMGISFTIDDTMVGTEGSTALIAGIEGSISIADEMGAILTMDDITGDIVAVGITSTIGNVGIIFVTGGNNGMDVGISNVGLETTFTIDDIKGATSVAIIDGTEIRSLGMDGMGIMLVGRVGRVGMETKLLATSGRVGMATGIGMFSEGILGMATMLEAIEIGTFKMDVRAS